MSTSTPVHLDPAVSSLLHRSGPDQLGLSRHAADRYALTEALADRRKAARRAGRSRSVWVRLRRAATRLRPA